MAINAIVQYNGGFESRGSHTNRWVESRGSHTNRDFSSPEVEIKIMPTSGERSTRGYTKFDFTVDKGKGRLNPSRDNNCKHSRRKVEKSCLTFLMCDPGWCVHKSDVQIKWDDNIQHTV